MDYRSPDWTGVDDSEEDDYLYEQHVDDKIDQLREDRDVPH